MFNKLVLVSFVFVGLLSCAKAPTVPPPPSFEAKFNQLEVGQTTEQVQALLGTPDLREVVSGVEIWHYSVNDLRRVEFKDKKVTGFARESAPGSELTANSTAIPASLKIGADCQTDKQCQSGNCHFKTCSGPNNCSRNIGDHCATDRECCGNAFCDFAVCKKKP